MKVKVASQTISSSMADGIGFLHNCGHPSFSEVSGHCPFHTCYRLFVLLYSRNKKLKNGPGYQQNLKKTKTEKQHARYHNSKEPDEGPAWQQFKKEHLANRSR